MASRGPKCENLSAWNFWDTGEFENGARSYIFITLKRLREYGKLIIVTDPIFAIPAKKLKGCDGVPFSCPRLLVARSRAAPCCALRRSSALRCCSVNSWTPRLGRRRLWTLGASQRVWGRFSSAAGWEEAHARVWLWRTRSAAGALPPSAC